MAPGEKGVPVKVVTRGEAGCFVRSGRRSGGAPGCKHPEEVSIPQPASQRGRASTASVAATPIKKLTSLGFQWPNRSRHPNIVKWDNTNHRNLRVVGLPAVRLRVRAPIRVPVSRRALELGVMQRVARCCRPPASNSMPMNSRTRCKEEAAPRTMRRATSHCAAAGK